VRANATLARPLIRREFREKVDERMKQTSCDYDSAFNYVTRYHANPSTKVNGQPPPTFLNAIAEDAPVASPATKALLCLPEDASQEMFEAALAGNGGTLAPFNPGKVFAALVELEQKSASVDYEPALRTVKGRCPALWAQCQAIAGK
jgi:hypothetical protein